MTMSLSKNPEFALEVSIDFMMYFIFNKYEHTHSFSSVTKRIEKQ